MQLHIRSKPSRLRNQLPRREKASYRATAGADLEFRRFRVLLRQRQLLADGVKVELGTRAFDLLLVLMEADGALVVMPIESIKFLQITPAPNKLPTYAIKGVKFKD